MARNPIKKILSKLFKKKKPVTTHSHPDDLRMSVDWKHRDKVMIGKEGESFTDMMKRYQKDNTIIKDVKQNITYNKNSKSFRYCRKGWKKFRSRRYI